MKTKNYYSTVIKPVIDELPHHTKKTAALIFLFLVIFQISNAQISYTTPASTYSQNFDGFLSPVPADNTTQSTPALPSGWLFTESGTGANTLYRVHNGGTNTGDTYVLGATGSSERAIGALASGSLTSQWGAFFTNNTGISLNRFTLTYVGEQWRDGGSATSVVNTISFAYAIGAASLTSGTYVNVTALDFAAPVSNLVSDVVLNGNLPANQTVKSFTVTGINWPNGTNLYIRWTDINDAGNDDALAIDDVVFSATECTNPILSVNSITNACAGFSNGAVNIDVSGSNPPFTFLWNTGATTEDITGVASGTYTVTVTSTGGCSSTISATVNTIALPTVSFTGLPSSICVNAGIITLTGNQAPSGAFSGAGIADNGNGTASFNPATATTGGPYNITYSYTDIATGCSNSQVQQVTVNDAPNLGPIAPVSNSCPQSTVDLSSITLTNSGAPGTTTYFATFTDATNNTNSISPVVNVSGNYYIRVTTAQGCFDIESVSVTITNCGCANPPLANAGTGFSICASNTAQLNGSISGGATSASWSGGLGNFNPDNNTLNAIYTPSAGEITAGFVTLTLTTDDPDSTGPCVAGVATVTITINSLPIVNITPQNESVCLGSSTGNLVANGAILYNWQPADGSLNATTGNTVIATPLVNTVYTVTGTDGNGCTSTAITSITVNNLPNVSITPAVIQTCLGTPTGLITANGATTYTWANATGLSATTGSTVTANPANNTIYTVTGTDNNSCTATATIEVNVLPLPVVTITGSSIFCDGSSTLLDAGSGYVTYLWSNSATTQSNNITTSGTYTVTVTDNNGCSTTATKTVQAAANPQINSITAQETCLGNTGSVIIAVNGGTPCAANSPGLLISKVLPNPAGTDSPFEFVELVATKNIDFSVTPYSVIFTNNGSANANGWKAGGSLSYGFEINTGTAIAGGVYYVGGSSMTPVNNHLRTINTSSSAGDGGLGNANVSGVLGNGGSNADGVAVFNGSIAAINSSTVPVDALFFGTGIGTAAIAGGTQGYQLPVNDLYSGGKLLSTSYFGPEPGNGLTIEATGTFNVLTNTFTTPRTFTNVAVFVEGVSGLNVITTPPYSYQWSGGTTLQNLTGAAAGTYTVTVSDCNGCSATASATVNVSNLLKPYLNIGDTMLCSNDSGITIIVSDSGFYSGGYPFGTTFNFYGSNNVLYQSGLSNSFLNQNNTDSFFVIVSLPAYIGYCSGSTDTILIDYNTNLAPQVVLQANNTICSGSSTGQAIVNIVFGGNSNFRYQWYDSGMNNLLRDVTKPGTNDSLLNVPAGMYIVVITDHQGATVAPYCSVTDSVYVSETLTPLAVSEIMGNHVDINCYGGLTGEIDIDVTGGTPGYSYNWNNGSTAEDLTALAAGTYTVTVTDQNNCTISLTSIIAEAAPLTVDISGNVQFCAGNSTSLTATSGYTSYLWSTGETTQAITTSNAGSYTVTVTNANGCTASTSATITVNPLPTPSISGANSVCMGNTTTISASAYYAYLWSNSATTQSIIAGGGTYTVTVTDANGCTASAIKSIAEVNSAPAQPSPINGPAAVCKNGSANFSIALVPGATSYTWTATAGASVISGQGTNAVTISFSAAATSSTISVVAANVCGSGPARTLAYTVSSVVPATPVAINGPLNGLCNMTNVNYNCPAVANATYYQWTVPAGALILSGQGTTSINVKFAGTFTGTGTLSVVAQSGCGSSAAVSRTLTAKPAQPVISGNNWACKGQLGVPYSVAPVAGASSYTWTVVAGSTLVSGQGTASIIVNWGAINGVITCKANNGCGSSIPGQKSVAFTCKEDGSLFDISDISLYPNPASTAATVQFESISEGKGQLMMFDLLGQQVAHEDISILNGNNQFVIDLNAHPKGIYYVRVNYNGTEYNLKLVVQ